MDTNGKTQDSGEVVAKEVLTSIRLSRAEHSELRRIAAREHRTMSAQIRAWIDAHGKEAA